MDDEDRDAILRRRNRFVSVALAGIATVGCGDDSVLPVPCLEPPIIETTPQPCLSEPVQHLDPEDPPSMGEQPQPGMEEPTPEDREAARQRLIEALGERPLVRPQACLSGVQPREVEEPTPEPRPRPCLSPVRRPVEGEVIIMAPQPCLSVREPNRQVQPTPQKPSASDEPDENV